MRFAVMTLIIVFAFQAQPVKADRFEVSTCGELGDALVAVNTNGEDDAIFIAAGSYSCSIYLANSDGKIIRFQGAPGTNPEDIIFDTAVSWLFTSYAFKNVGSIYFEGLTFQNAGDKAFDLTVAKDGLSVNINRCIFKDNLSKTNGAAIYLEAENKKDVTLNITNSIFTNNLAINDINHGRGGAIYTRAAGTSGDLETFSTVNVSIINCLFVGNKSYWGGGALSIYNTETGAANRNITKIINCTFVNNACGANHTKDDALGGAIDCNSFGTTPESILEFYGYNSIIYDNQNINGTTAHDLNFFCSYPNSGIIGLNNCDIGSNIISRAQTVSNSSINAPPQFVDSQNGNYYLHSYSPCIDAGTANTPIPLPAIDLLGNSRIYNGLPDIGAIEFIGTQTINNQLDNSELSLNVVPTVITGYANIYFEMPTKQWVNLSIHDLSGSLIKSLYIGEVNAGQSQFSWKGDNSFGQIVSNGVYILKLQTSKEIVSKNVIMLR
jgi:hypothetical protein